MSEKEIVRCAWAGTDPLMIDYHDRDWGVPLHDDRKLFEFLNLEGMQAGLSWMTILRKRDNFRQAFDDFDPQVITRYDQAKVEQLLSNPALSATSARSNQLSRTPNPFLRFKQNLAALLHTCGDLWMERRSLIHGGRWKISLPKRRNQPP